MSQVSMPIRVLLAVTLVAAAAWLVVLRPKAEAPAPAPAPAAPAGATTAPVHDPGAATQSAPGQAVHGATTAPAHDPGAATQSAPGQAVQGATAAAQAASGAASAAAGEASPTGTRPTAAATAATPGAGSGRVAALPPLPRAALATLPSDVRRALRARRVIVLGILDTSGKPWAPMADDERRVRAELRHVNRYGGRVLVKIVPASRLARYGALVKGVQLAQTPTVVVIDRNRRASTLVGYADRVTIDQVILDARRRSTARRITDPRLRRANVLCARYLLRAGRLGLPVRRGVGRAWARRYERLAARYGRLFAAVPARGRYARVRGALLAQLGHVEGLWRAARRGEQERASAEARAVGAGFPELDRRLERAGLTACVADRRR